MKTQRDSARQAEQQVLDGPMGQRVGFFTKVRLGARSFCPLTTAPEGERGRSSPGRAAAWERLGMGGAAVLKATALDPIRTLAATSTLVQCRSHGARLRRLLPASPTVLSTSVRSARAQSASPH